MKDTISVIVPVYNVEKYLPKCMDSILSQDHRALQVILIDDGSTDGSGAICDEYAARDPRVTVIHQINAGAAAAKNAGLRMATGTYLSFVDSDDYLEPNVYGYMVQTLESSGVAAVHFSFREEYRDHGEDQIHHRGGTVMDHETYLRCFPKDWSCPLLWNKLYRRDLYEGVFFEEGHKIDDEYFTYQGFLKPCKILWDDRVIYHYRKRASGVMADPQTAGRRLMDCLDATCQRRDRIIVACPGLKGDFDENYLDTIWYLSENYGNTRQTIGILRSHLKGYFQRKGNRFPPRYLWLRLLKLYLAPMDKLLKYCNENREDADPEQYFP